MFLWLNSCELKKIIFPLNFRQLTVDETFVVVKKQSNALNCFKYMSHLSRLID